MTKASGGIGRGVGSIVSDAMGGMMGGEEFRRYLRGVFLPEAATIIPHVGERGFDLLTIALATVMVERRYGEEGLGVYSFSVATMILCSYTTDFGLSRRTAYRLAGPHGDRQGNASLPAAIRDQLTLGAVVLFALTALSGFFAAVTAVTEHALLYPLLGLCILVHNFNRLRIAAMHGLGLHRRSACLQVRRRVFFVAVLLAFVFLKVPASFRLGAFLVSDLLVIRTGNTELGLSRIRDVLRGPFSNLRGLRERLGEAASGFLTDEALEMILFVDLLVLGFFASSETVGAYAEALLLGRFFLLVPAALEPLLVRKYAREVASTGEGGPALGMRRSGRAVFMFHGILSLLVLLFFPRVLEFLFGANAARELPFSVFTVVLPGFLLYGAIAPMEPLYEVLGRQERLRSLALWVIAVNWGLNLYLVPFAGPLGAAAATTLTLSLYFVLVGNGLPAPYQVTKFRYVLGLGAFYLCYVLMKGRDVEACAALVLIPAIAVALLWISGFFAATSFEDPVRD